MSVTPKFASPTSQIRFFGKLYSDEEPRDDHGRWTSGGASTGENGHPNGHGAPRVPIRKAAPAEFNAALKGVKRPEFISFHSDEELASHKLFLTEDGKAGVAVSPEGDLQNLFNASDKPGVGGSLVEHALENGAITLDAYDGFLPKLYAKHGFVETGRIKFNDEYAKPGFIEKYGRPDIVFMAHGAEASPGRYYDGSEWDAAKADSRAAALASRASR